MQSTVVTKKEPAFVTLLLLFSFASTCGVLFTPALPEMAKFFNVSEGAAQLTVTLYLLGYALGQLVYGPIANRLGRKTAILMGIALEIFSALLCAFTAFGAGWEWLIVGRFLMAIGAAVGLSMTFAIVSESDAPARALKMMSYLALAFALMPYLSIVCGGLLVTYFSWASCFYFLAFYGVLLFFFCAKLPKSTQLLNPHALKLRHLWEGYRVEFKNPRVVCYAMMGGCNTVMIYAFAGVAPFVAMNVLKMSPVVYGIFNLVPGVGIVMGALLSVYYSSRVTGERLLLTGLILATPGLLAIPLIWFLDLLNAWTLFLPMLFVFIGGALVFSAVPSLAAAKSSHKVNTASAFSFINMMTAVVAVLLLNILNGNLLLEFPFVVLSVVVMYWSLYLKTRRF